jgi:hypothetical protein
MASSSSSTLAFVDPWLTHRHVSGPPTKRQRSSVFSRSSVAHRFAGSDTHPLIQLDELVRGSLGEARQEFRTEGIAVAIGQRWHP